MRHKSPIPTFPKFLRTILAVVCLLLIINGSLLLHVKNLVNEEKMADREMALLEYESSMPEEDYRNVLELSIMKVLATSYNSTFRQTDSDPHITANGDRVDEYTIALSRDLIRAENDLMVELGFNPQGIVSYGDTVDVIYMKRVIVRDAMNRRFMNRADLWTRDYPMARRWGIREVFMVHKKGEK